MSVPFADFASLAALHRELEEQFLQHQDALLDLDVALAAERLDAYEAALRRHLEAEEALLLPVFARAGRIRGASPELFTGEHQRLLEFLARFRAALRALDSKAPDFKRAVLRLLDAETTFKHLSHHHELREETHFFPALDSVTDETERRELLAAFTASVAP
ncbi:hemerythrin domain-containing protein [Pyxidicoccus parkwayensis]|uniref:Hemerythrin domain-containing protein n=1 Tax=Pyxidicoccus parkwayensis TaxID=2813578 RepID=A0ABX7NR39_9BACT|nr:hemerythrin domain-containing protein [Pyxidicoccus parkwaysis]QSQ19924.1 hemerythrin domain-containing protein [Pyxidicoccus parkwaysis]